VEIVATVEILREQLGVIEAAGSALRNKITCPTLVAFSATERKRPDPQRSSRLAAHGLKFSVIVLCTETARPFME